MPRQRFRNRQLVHNENGPLVDPQGLANYDAVHSRYNPWPTVILIVSTMAMITVLGFYAFEGYRLTVKAAEDRDIRQGVNAFETRKLEMAKLKHEEQQKKQADIQQEKNRKHEMLQKEKQHQHETNENAKKLKLEETKIKEKTEQEKIAAEKRAKELEHEKIQKEQQRQHEAAENERKLKHEETKLKEKGEQEKAARESQTAENERNRKHQKAEDEKRRKHEDEQRKKSEAQQNAHQAREFSERELQRTHERHQKYFDGAIMIGGAIANGMSGGLASVVTEGVKKIGQVTQQKKTI